MTMDPRHRLTTGINRARLVTEAKRAARPSVFLVAGLVAAVAIASYFLTNISEVIGKKTYEVRFEVSDAFGIFEGFDDVRFRGVKAGTIKKIERRGAQVVLVAEIRKDRGTVYRDARAQLRPITPLNDIYLDIVDPGSPKAGKASSDQPLDESQTDAFVTVPEVLDVFDSDVRGNVHRLLDQLGNGMEGGGVELRRALVALGPFLEEAGGVSRQIAIRKHVTRRLIHNSAVVTTELGQREKGLRRLVSTGAATLGSLHGGSDDLEATLAELGPTLTELRSSLAAVRGVVDDVDAGVNSLYPVAERLPQGLRALRALNASLGPAVDRLRRPVRTLLPWVTQLDRVSDRLPPIATALRPLVPTVDRLSRRLVDCEKGVIGFFQWNTSLTKFGDENAPIPRGNLAFGVPAVGLPGEPLREPAEACTPGPVPRGVPTEEDTH